MIYLYSSSSSFIVFYLCFIHFLQITLRGFVSYQDYNKYEQSFLSTLWQQHAEEGGHDAQGGRQHADALLQQPQSAQF